MPGILVEACVATLATARDAAQAGAARLELCDDREVGGVTPDLGLTALVRRETRLPLHVLIRSRGGGFRYEEHEVRDMLAQIGEARAAGVDGVVIGALDEEGRVDRAITQRLMAAARPGAVTFHKAFDEAREPFEALETLTELGVERLLTSGQGVDAWSGRATLRALVQQSAGRIEIMAGGAIQPAQVADILREGGVRELHVGAQRDAGRLRGVLGLLQSEMP